MSKQSTANELALYLGEEKILSLPLSLNDLIALWRSPELHSQIGHARLTLSLAGSTSTALIGFRRKDLGTALIHQLPSLAPVPMGHLTHLFGKKLDDTENSKTD